MASPNKRVKRSKTQATLADMYKYHAYGMVFTFPMDVFGSPGDEPFEELWKDELADFLEKNGFENIRVAVEYGEAGLNPHLDVVMTRKDPMRIDNMKRKVMQITGLTVKEISDLSEPVRRHWVKISELSTFADLENRINYNIKEKGKTVTKGELFTPTWIQEASVNAEKRKELVRCKSANTQFVNDANFAEVVKEYVQNLPEESRSDDMMVVLPWMDRDGYNFCRVRDKRYAIARYYALACRDTQASARYWSQFNV